MGWISTTIDQELAGKHEGYVVGSVSDKDGRLTGFGRLRELRAPQDGAKNDRLVTVQMGCDCGWRSPHVLAIGATWHPFAVFVKDDAREDALVERWRAHVADEATRADVKRIEEKTADWKRRGEPGRVR